MVPEPLTHSQYYAWQKSVELGTRLAEEHPEIREKYESSWTLERIAEEFNVENTYNASRRVAVTSVAYALSLLIPELQREQLRISHHQDGARKRYELHGSAFTEEDCRKGANNLYRKLTKKEKRAKSLKAVAAQGKIHWANAEIRAFKRKYLDDRYSITSGTNY